MPKPVYPENFDTEIINEGFYVTDDRGTVAAISNMGSLANKLLNNEKVDAYDRAMAGAIIRHFIALNKAATSKAGRKGPLKAGDKVEYRDSEWPLIPGWNGRGTLASALTYDDGDTRGYYIDSPGITAQVFIFVGNVRRAK
jgi:hypothetical protein